MNLPRQTAKKIPNFDGLPAVRDVHLTEVIMTEKKAVWQQAHKQAGLIGKAKTKAERRKQIVAWCELVNAALRSGRG